MSEVGSIGDGGARQRGSRGRRCEAPAVGTGSAILAPGCLRAVVLLLAVVLLPSGAFCGEWQIYLRNRDHLSGKELSLDQSALSILTPHCGRVVIERSGIKGISSDAGQAREILESMPEGDVVHNRNGDRLSGEVVEIKGDSIFVKAFFAEDRIVEVKLDQFDYLVFASQEKVEPTVGSDDVRVIFVNGDVLSGAMAGFEGGQFVLATPYSGKVRFGGGAFRSLHSAKRSKEFFEGGIAEAIMDVLERSGEAGGSYARIYPPLVKSFLKEGNREGAMLVLRRISSYVRDQYVFQLIGDHFLAENMLAAAVQAYEKMMETRPTSYYPYSKLFNAYTKSGRYAEAAATYEQMLSHPGLNLTGYGTSIEKVRMELGEVYVKLKEFDKAAEQFRQVMASSAEEELREKAVSSLIGLFKEQGKIAALIAKYEAELEQSGELIGETYLEMVKMHVREGNFMKARSYVERMERIGLSKYAEEARQLLRE
jgi:pentatricopeptide repeat protein